MKSVVPNIMLNDQMMDAIEMGAYGTISDKQG